MTIEEKRSEIERFCGGFECCECPLMQIDEIRNQTENCYTPSDSFPANIERNYSILFGGKEKTDDVVNHPSHYTSGSIECIDAMESAFGADELAVYCKIAAFKYIWRCKLKNGSEDVKKAIWYLNKYLELSEGTNHE